MNHVLNGKCSKEWLIIILNRIKWNSYKLWRQRKPNNIMDYSILVLLILNSLYIFGFHNSTYYEQSIVYEDTIFNKEILWRIRWHLRKSPAWIQKPVFDCVTCMASLHSFPYLIFHHELTLTNGATYIIYIFALSGLNKFVHDRIS